MSQLIGGLLIMDFAADRLQVLKEFAMFFRFFLTWLPVYHNFTAASYGCNANKVLAVRWLGKRK